MFGCSPQLFISAENLFKTPLHAVCWAPSGRRSQVAAVAHDKKPAADELGKEIILLIQQKQIQFNFQSSVLLCLCRDNAPGSQSVIPLTPCTPPLPFQISPSVKLPSSLPPLPLYDQPPISPFTSPETSTRPPLPRSPSAALNGEHKHPPPASSHKGPLSTHSKSRYRLEIQSVDM